MGFFPPREKIKEQERDELWKKLDELKLSRASVVQNNSHGVSAVLNNNNSNNNNNGTQESSSDAEATDVIMGDKGPDGTDAASESASCAK